jgi:hypothetical protein
MREQTQRDIVGRGGHLRHRVQLHPRQAFPPEVYMSHPYCLYHDEDAWPHGCDLYQG